MSKNGDIETAYRYRTNESPDCGRPVVISKGIGDLFGAYFRKENGCLKRLTFIEQTDCRWETIAFRLLEYFNSNKRQKKLIKSS